MMAQAVPPTFTRGEPVHAKCVPSDALYFEDLRITALSAHLFLGNCVTQRPLGTEPESRQVGFRDCSKRLINYKRRLCDDVVAGAVDCIELFMRLIALRNLGVCSMQTQ